MINNLYIILQLILKNFNNIFKHKFILTSYLYKRIYKTKFIIIKYLND